LTWNGVQRSHLWDATCKIQLIWADKIKTVPNVTKITINLPQFNLIIVTWERFRPFTLSFLGSVACPKNGWKLNIIHNHSKCVHDKNEYLFTDVTTLKPTHFTDLRNNPKLQEMFFLRLGKLSNRLNTILLLLLLLLLLFWKVKIQSHMITRWSRKLITWELGGREEFQHHSADQGCEFQPKLQNLCFHLQEIMLPWIPKKRHSQQEENSFIFWKIWAKIPKHYQMLAATIISTNLPLMALSTIIWYFA